MKYRLLALTPWLLIPSIALANPQPCQPHADKPQPSAALDCLPWYRAPMLAYSYSGETVDGWLASEKYDGIRVLWTGEKLFSRQGKRLHAPATWTENFPPFALDGELWRGRGQFEQTVGQIRRGDFADMGFYVFDVPEAHGNLLQRLQILQDWLKMHPNPHIHLIEQKSIANIAEARTMLQHVEAKGGEGLILRDPEAAYQYGRSHAMLKLKSLFDAECTVTAHIMGKGKYHNRLGALECRLDNGKLIYIGSGLSDKERDNPPPIGSIITFQYNGRTQKGLPRFPRFYRPFTPIQP